MLARTAVIFALTLIPVTAAAQNDSAATRTLPLLSADALIGVATGPSRIGPTSYYTTAIAARVALAMRLGSRGAVRPVLVLDFSAMPGTPDGDDVAGLPGTPFKQQFLEHSGFGLGLGARGALGSRLTIGATGGFARYQDHFTTFSSRRTSFFFDADAAFGFSRHFGAVLNVRHVELPKAAGARVWFRPLTIGLRIQ